MGKWSKKFACAWYRPCWGWIEKNGGVSALLSVSTTKTHWNGHRPTPKTLCTRYFFL